MPPSRIGHYTIVAELGRGGMGVVYKAHEESLNRFVAIKVLSEQLASDPTFVARFVREAQAAAGLNHPNIIQIFYIGEEEGQHYFVMEYVSGKSLHAIVREETRVPNPRAAGYIAQAALGLAAAHDKGILHRDIKPANLMVNEHGLVKIADFGLALPQDAATRLTMTGTLMGTPGYLSPEQCLGKPLDLRTDIYSLGVTYFELLTGTIPFQADSPLALMRKILEEPPPDIGTLNDAVDAETRRIVDRMIARNRDERYQTCHDLATDLDRYLGSRGVRVSTPGAIPLPVPSEIEEGATTRMPKSEPQVAAVVAPGPVPATPALPPPAAAPSASAPAAPAATPAPSAAAAPAAAAVASAQTDGAVPAPAEAPAVPAGDAEPAAPPAAASQPVAPAVSVPPAPPSRAPLIALAAVLLLLAGGGVAEFLALRSPAAKGLLSGLLGHGKAAQAAASAAASDGADADHTARTTAQDTASPASAAASDLGGASAGSAGQAPSGSAAAVPPEAGQNANGARTAEAGPDGAGAAAPSSAQSAPVAESRGGEVRQGGMPRAASRHRVSRASGSAAGQEAASRQVTVIVTGAQPFAGALGGALVTELQSAGLEPVDGQSVPSIADALGGGGQPALSALLATAREAGLRTLVVARVDPAGERQLNYMGRYDTAYSARVTATCYDVRSGRPLGASAATTVEFTSLNIDRAAEKAAGALSGPIAERLR